MAKCIARISTLLLILVFQQVNAQHEFSEAILITHEKDSLRGHITISNKNEYLFTKDAHQKKQPLSPDHISRIVIDEHTVFESKRIILEGEEQTVFLKLLVDGKSRLYHLPQHNQKAYWIEEKDGKMYVLANEKLESVRSGKSYTRYTHAYRGILKNIFNDQPELFSDIDKLNYNEKALIDFYQKYHEQSSLPYEVYHGQKKEVALEWGLTTGMQFSTLKFVATDIMSDLLDPAFDMSTNFNFGLFVEEILLGMDRRSLFRIEAIYHHTDHSNEILRLRMNNLKIPITYKYLIIPSSPLKPYLSLGPAVNFLLSVKDESSMEKFNNNWLHSGKVQYGVEASSGIGINKRFFLQLRYSFYYGNHATRTEVFIPGTGYMPETESFRSISQTIGIQGGIKF